MSDMAASDAPVASHQDFRPRTGLIFDDEMTRHNCCWDSGHIERPERYMSSLQKIKEYDLKSRCCVLPSKRATKEELLSVHTEAYINDVKNSANLEDSDALEKFSSKYDSVFFNHQTYDCALLAAGCALELVSSVLKGTLSNGLAVVRPPGHHAMVEKSCGFCFFNNVAIAAKHALEKFGLKRILIVDWDVHHGQGTQQIFYDDPRVLYFSIHRYENGEFWPHLRESQFDFTGGPSAQGFNINVPLNGTGQGNSEYLAIFNNVLLPAAYEFCPELVLISAGFDAALGCPEGRMTVTPQAYPHLLNSLSCLAKGRVCVILEGGYCISSLSECVALTLRGLLGDPCPSISPCRGLSNISVESILNTLSIQRPFWHSLNLQNTYDSGFEDDGSDKHLVKIRYAGNPLEGLAVYKTRGDYPVVPPSVIAANEAEIEDLIRNTDLSVPKYRTGFVLDTKVLDSACTVTDHPETNKHVVAFYEKLQESNLLSKCLYVHSQEPSVKEKTLVHSSNFLETHQSNFAASDESIQDLSFEFAGFEFCYDSKTSVAAACRKLLALVDAVASRVCLNGFVLTRSIGHISDNESASGVSKLDSVAVAAKFLIAKHKMEKILIVDLDATHGNGTQTIFYEDNKVLYVSLPYHDREFFSTLPEAKEKQVGQGSGKGFNVNIPFSHSVVDGDYLAAFFHVILPVAYEFCPQFVLVNLGYDDSRTLLTPSSLAVMTKLLSGLSNGKIVLISENNFSVKGGPDMAAHCLSVLLGENCVPLRPSKPTPEGIEAIRNVVKVQKDFWRCLAFDVEVPDKLSSEELEKRCNESVGMKGVVGKRRQSSDPVAIPKVQETGMSLMLEFEKSEGFPSDTFFCVTPLEYCPHLELLQPIPTEGLNPKAPCVVCNDLNENWVCLHCYQVYCGRFINQHMMHHGLDMKHYLTLSYSDLSVWCYACDAYIHNNQLVAVKEHAHDKKFNLI